MGLCLPDDPDLPPDLPIHDATLPIGTRHVNAVDSSGNEFCPVREYIMRCNYAVDVAKFQKLCQTEGAHILQVIRAPFWNVWGSVVSGSYVMVYQHTEELDMMVYC